MTTDTGTPPPWYKQFWPWLLISIPAATAIAGFATIWIASSEPVALVNDDYYKEGLAVNRDLAKDRNALAQGVAVELVFDLPRQQVFATLQGHQGDGDLQLNFIHPMAIDRDQTITLQRQANSTYMASSALAADRWYLELESTTGDMPWRLKGEVDLRSTASILLQAKPH